MRIALGLEYAGSAFCGFQTQPSRCGVQDALETAIGAVAAHPVSIVAAGRTDAGVHAISQVVHFDADVARPESAWVRGVNTNLPPSAAILWSCEVAGDFHARFCATARHYTYLLENRPQRPGLRAGRVGWFHQPLDVDAMREAAAALLGTHDFTSFRAAECQAKTPVRTVTRADIGRDGDLVRFDFCANAFLHHMVRNLVGALVAIGARCMPATWIGELLLLRDRSEGAATFAADGLYFAGADYDVRFGLPSTVRKVAAA